MFYLVGLVCNGGRRFTRMNPQPGSSRVLEIGRQSAIAIANAKAEGYWGRPEDAERNAAAGRMLAAKQSWGAIQSVTGCSRATIAKIAKRIKQAG
jgi:DNA invertase Pin-like site-specific DNA recombinase